MSMSMSMNTGTAKFVATSYTFAQVTLVSVCRQVLDSLGTLHIFVFQCMRAQGKHLMYLVKIF